MYIVINLHCIYLVLDWQDVATKQHKESMDQFSEIHSKINMIMEAVQALASEMQTKDYSTIKPNPSVTLPKLPMRIVDEVLSLNTYLQDPVFMDQMVNIRVHHNKYINIY